MGTDKVLTQPVPLMTVKLEGPLTKWTNVVQGWQYRWFVLDENTGLLSYYTSKDKMMRGARRGCLRLKEGKIGINDEDDSTFTITCDHRTFHFQARDADERTRWVQCLEETIMKHSHNNPDTTSMNMATEDELNKRMQEAEVYFRLVTEQAKNLELKIAHSNKPKTERSVLLQDSLTQMVESMGQTIELLYSTKQALAKKVPVPVIQNKSKQIGNEANNMVVDDATGSVVAVTKLAEFDVAESCNKPDSAVYGEDVVLINEEINLVEPVTSQNNEWEENSDENGPTVASMSLQNEEDVIANVPIHLLSIANASVPINSYTSSDEEEIDEFFDAPDEFDEIAVDKLESSIKLESDINFQTVLSDSQGDNRDPIIFAAPEVEAPQKPQHVRIDPKLLFHDDCEEWDVEDDPIGDGDGAADMQQHGSVITHLLSQVRIGMDLTKVTLPTFILERRSLLEMYADFFAHPDIFKGISDQPTPELRMIQVLKWCLSSFHAGRKGDVAKKPYNPILGEIFQCYYDLSSSTVEGGEASRISNNYGTEPVPWANKSDVSFLAEQVSHHPPISAFYAECEEKHTCFNAHIWTKSKFLGLSIGVHNVGTGHLYLSDHNEEYVITFPNGYGRSILTVPWIELGGKTEITCQATGYSAQLEFLTKPFYGGKKNRITADVFGPHEKKSLASVSGEWNGIMHVKYPAESGKEPEVFFDTISVPTIKKKVRSLNRQEKFESRYMWKQVTKALREDHIEGATEEKHRLEEIQRQDARMRKETNMKWVTRFFDEFGEGEERKFHYKRPLYSRLGLGKPGSKLHN